MKKKIKILLLLTLFTSQILYSQWVQQTLPVSGQIRDLAFLNKDTGFVALNNTDVLLKTSNGRVSWETVNTFRISQLCIGDKNTLFGIAVNGSKMYRTFNGGASFDSVGAPGGGYCNFYFVNKDTGWSSGLTGIFMTTNSGSSYQLISTDANCGTRMFFVRQKYNNQYYGFHIDNGLFKTTNSGVNWISVAGVSTNAIHCFFINKDTGWVTDRPPIDNYKILYTTNNGNNWIEQYSSSISINYLFFINTLKGWCGTDTSNTILATVNSGILWGKQIIPIFNSGHTVFVDSIVGWTSNGFNFNNLTKTTNGGGAIIYIGIDSNRTFLPQTFTLEQNYPNPFNPQTTILFSISRKSNVSLIIYDILGKEVLKIYDNELLNSGNYKSLIDFSKINISSGIYFYTIKINDNSYKQLFLETKKMIYTK